MSSDTCPCGSEQGFIRCCGPVLSGKLPAASPERLMRSRYTAFVKGDIDYLINTHHPSKRQSDDRDRLAATIQATEWLGLQVVSSEVEEGHNRGTVEFVATYQPRSVGAGPINGSLPLSMHEKSSFVRKKGKWFYLDGQVVGP